LEVDTQKPVPPVFYASDIPDKLKIIKLINQVLKDMEKIYLEEINKIN